MSYSLHDQQARLWRCAVCETVCYKGELDDNIAFNTETADGSVCYVGACRVCRSLQVFPALDGQWADAPRESG